MRLVAAIEDPEVTRKILECVDLPARAPPLATAASESVEHDADAWDDAPAWDFDQTLPDGYDSE